MTQINVSQILRLTAGILACWLGLIASVQATEIQMQVQAAPATPTSNITGGCLGYFSAQTVSSKKRFVKF